MSATSPKVTINSTTITGKHIPSSPSKYPTPVEVFYNIPYATCRRFQAPQPLSAPSSPLNGSKPGPPQPTAFSSGPTAESPLTLNIFRPVSPSAVPDEKDDSPKALLPVVVFLHGGGFNFGSPLDGDQDSFVSWGSKGAGGEGDSVIAVSASYRLGPLGFLGEEGSELNLGLRDQRVAIDWVKKWIGHWGGNGDRITVRGVSAGAHSIGYHILNPKPLGITKFILESGSSTSRSVLHPSHSRVASQLQALKKSSKHAPLQTLPVDNLVNNAVMVFGDHSQPPTWPFQPVVDAAAGDQATIPDLPLNLWDDFLKEGRAKDISVLTGFCSHEGVDFVPTRGYNTNAEFRKWFQQLLPTFSDSDLDALEALYPDPATNPSSSPYADTGAKCTQWKRLADAYAHYAYICPVLHTAHSLSVAGARVYVYEFAQKSPPHDMAGHASQSWAVEHAVDGRQAAGKAATEAKLADEMNRRWVKFVAQEDGDLGGLWPRFESRLEGTGGGETAGWGKILVFGGEGGVLRERELTQREKDVCRFWWERMELSQGMGKRGVARRKY